MAKKTSRKKVVVDAAATISIIKLRLTPAEAKRIRIAAALDDKRTGAFARDAVLAHAEALIAKGLG